MENAPGQQIGSLSDQGIFFPQIRKASKHILSWQQAALLMGTLALLVASFLMQQQPKQAVAACSGRWHRVVAGDSLSGIAYYNRTTISAVANANAIQNVHLIYTGQNLCIPQSSNSSTYTTNYISGLETTGQVRWYAHNALEYSNRSQVATLIRNTAARYNIPANLLLAISWQESGWTQQVIARDGGIGAMQIMPYTANGLNRQVNGSYDPYKLQDNIELSAILVRSLWRIFNGDVTKIISAYNQGAWNVQNRGIFNWSYVNNVKALMQRY